MTKKLSIIVPCYYEEETIPLFYEAVEKVKKELNGIELEYWFVNDGSQDGTLDEMRKLNAKDKEHVHYVSFSRNFGKEAALYCGLQQATGDYITVMDADLQDPPDMLPEMIEILENEDYDCVGTRRTNRKGSMTEYNRFSKGIFSWVGFNTKYLEYKNQERVAGTTSWNFWSLLKYSIDGIVNFSQAPLDIAVYFGMLTSFFSGIGIVWIIIRYFLEGGDPTTGWTSTICLLLFFSGIQLMCLGIVGKYIGKIFSEVKRRPVYIIKEKK